MIFSIYQYRPSPVKDSLEIQVPFEWFTFSFSWVFSLLHLSARIQILWIYTSHPFFFVLFVSLTPFSSRRGTSHYWIGSTEISSGSLPDSYSFIISTSSHYIVLCNIGFWFFQLYSSHFLFIYLHTAFSLEKELQPSWCSISKSYRVFGFLFYRSVRSIIKVFDLFGAGKERRFIEISLSKQFHVIYFILCNTPNYLNSISDSFWLNQREVAD